MQGAYLLNEIQDRLPKVEMINELSESNLTNPVFQTIFDGKADMDIDKFQVTHERFRWIDFGMIGSEENFDGIFIFALNELKVQANVFHGIFDRSSTIVIVLLSILLILLDFITFRQCYCPCKKSHCI